MGTKELDRESQALGKFIRFRVSHRTHAAIERLRKAYTRKFQDQARRCLELGVEAEEQGGVEPMLNAKIEAAVRAQVDEAMRGQGQRFAEAMKDQSLHFQAQLEDFEKKVVSILKEQSKKKPPPRGRQAYDSIGKGKADGGLRARHSE